MSAAEALAAELHRLGSLNAPPVCVHDPEQWFSLDPDERAEAAGRCQPCPIRTHCHDGAVENDERWGVWGGVDFTRSLRNPRRATA